MLDKGEPWKDTLMYCSFFSSGDICQFQGTVKEAENPGFIQVNGYIWGPKKKKKTAQLSVVSQAQRDKIRVLRSQGCKEKEEMED